MIQQTVARLLPLAPPKQFWIITNDDLRPAILKQLPKLPKSQILAEPIGRNTAPAIGLAAFLLLRENSDAVIGMFPSDHVIADEKGFAGGRLEGFPKNEKPGASEECVEGASMGIVDKGC